jgi:ribosomal protein S18 acetylase RimI-like enzyme
MSITIRKATPLDKDAVSKICLLTADAGKSADGLHDIKELPGLVYAVPYVKLLPYTATSTWGFVMEVDETGEVVGYILGAKDTREYEQYTGEHWWPSLVEKYSPSDAKRKADVRYCERLRDPHIASEAAIAFASAHMHINVLEAYQRKGWGKRLIGTAVGYLRGEDIRGDGLWLGFDPRNVDAKNFYERIGFKSFEGAEDNELGLKFVDWKY